VQQPRLVFEQVERPRVAVLGSGGGTFRLLLVERPQCTNVVGLADLTSGQGASQLVAATVVGRVSRHVLGVDLPARDGYRR
jgi:hypothetical protein